LPHAAAEAHAATWFDELERTAALRLATARRRRGERDLIMGRRRSMTYEPSEEPELRRMLDYFLPAMQRGERFIIVAGATRYTLSLARYEDLIARLQADMVLLEEGHGSDAAIIDVMINNRFRIERPDHRKGAKWSRKAGEFFAWTHDYECPELEAELAKLGCWRRVDHENYKENCIYKAFKAAGCSNTVLADLAATCRMRKVSRKNLKIIADRHKLLIKIHTDGDRNLVVVGPRDGETVELGLLHEHYFHYHKTVFTAWAVENYDQVKSKKSWWTHVSANDRKKTRGMNSLDLMRAILKGPHVKPIDISTDGIFRTQFHDKASTTFENGLEYPETAVRRFHPKRFCEDEPDEPDWPDEIIDDREFDEPTAHEAAEADKADEQAGDAQAKVDYAKVNMSQQLGGVAQLARLEAKFARTGMGPAEQLKLLDKHKLYAANVFYDFETKTEGSKHKEFSVSYEELERDENYRYSGDDCALHFLNHLAKSYGVPMKRDKIKMDSIPKVKILAHNHTYDLSFIIPHLTRLTTIERSTNIITGSGMYSLWGDSHDLVVRLVFQDTCKMISMPLADFPKSFDLADEKEVMPYSLYTKRFIDAGGVATQQQIERHTKKGDLPQLMANLERLECQVEGGYDMMRYCEYYCGRDVTVLKEGWKVFRASMLEIGDLDIMAYPTMASLADAYFTEAGCYDGVYEVSGVPLAFMAKAMIGGRTMVAENKKSKFASTEELAKTLADFDGVSLYPSAMARIPGYLRGTPKVWDASVDLTAVDGYFVKIFVKTVGREWRFPITCLKTEAGNNWTNDLEGKELIVDRFTLEDLVRWSDITYDILQGYYFDEGRNDTINDVIRTIFEQRLVYKRQKRNSLQLCIKELMNSAYGICALKPIDTDISYVGEDKAANYTQNNFNAIKEYTVMGNGTYRFQRYKEIESHYNRVHVATEILSISKTIMNEVKCTAEEIGERVYYGDTDSMHIESDAVPRLADAFRERYGRELIGNQLGQFHTDFDYKTCMSIVDGHLVPTTDKSTGEICATDSMFLGKKSYIDRLIDEAGTVAYHIRLKGIPTACIVEECDRHYGGDPMRLFQQLYDGVAIEFSLGSNGHVMFRTGKDHSVRSDKMIRKVQF